MKERIKSIYATPILKQPSRMPAIRPPEEFTPVDSYEDYKRNKLKDEFQELATGLIVLVVFSIFSIIFFDLLYSIK